VGVRPEERLVGAGLDPPRHELGLDSPEEPPHIRPDEAYADHVDGQEHRSGNGEVRPLGGVVPGPNRSSRDSLRAGVERAREDEGPLVPGLVELAEVAAAEAVGSGAVEEVAVEVVPL